jgi:hypothetical protein
VRFFVLLATTPCFAMPFLEAGFVADPLVLVEVSDNWSC